MSLLPNELTEAMLLDDEEDQTVGSSIKELAQDTHDLFGKKSVAPIVVMGMQAEALLDTGSETSIAPLALPKLAREKNVDIDAYVEKIPGVRTVVRNASRDRMEFIDTIRMEVELKGRKAFVSFHGKALDDLVILGTNALEVFGMELKQTCKLPQPTR
ncbi:hypothetical protein OESDEN_04426 [Oesophagostomum dentatum]|uniref:Peptidase A2 domain-containing protein n=1 Tax=Oesophagostomum dentatum TaxID=61180 RepID=A0A0B1TJS9_OESDE|nr:hypothetical protein OESDEN_04426 [Oesophagostomum dentatum]